MSELEFINKRMEKYMAGTKAGGQAARDTNIKKYGNGFYSKIGSKGGKLSHTGGFASDVIGPDGLTGKERARVVGSKGGSISRRNAREKQS